MFLRLFWRWEPNMLGSSKARRLCHVKKALWESELEWASLDLTEHV